MEKKANENLTLVLSDAAYEITGTKEKMFELRKDSQWIRRKLFDRKGEKIEYKTITFQRAYRLNAEKKKFQFDYIIEVSVPERFVFANGLTFELEEKDFMIVFSEL